MRSQLTTVRLLGALALVVALTPYIALCVTLLAGCHSEKWRHNPDIYAVPYQGEATTVLQNWLAEAYAVDRFDIYDIETRVLWSDERCPYRPEDLGASVYTYGYAGCVAGIMHHCTEIYSGIHPWGVGFTALQHELGHCYRGYLSAWLDWPEKGADGNHSDAQFWAVVSDSVEFAREQDWPCDWCEVVPYAGDYP